jgi:hypothetical protein
VDCDCEVSQDWAEFKKKTKKTKRTTVVQCHNTRLAWTVPELSEQHRKKDLEDWSRSAITTNGDQRRGNSILGSHNHTNTTAEGQGWGQGQQHWYPPPVRPGPHGGRIPMLLALAPALALSSGIGVVMAPELL